MHGDLAPARRALRRLEGRRRRARLEHALTLLACLFTLGWAQPAPYALGRFERASAALARSVTVFADDPVESLDALRRAKAASTPLLGRLEPPLRQGLTTTFARAEEAIVNRSEADLRVQAAVLRGGLQRTLYLGALETADTDLPRAHTLLGVLAGDLGFAERGFSETTRGALQTAFERRLAALSLEQLSGLGDAGEDLESRYETLAQVYSQIFLVQDSPRLPEQAQPTLLSAIGALVADEPLAALLTKLRAQLTRFERNAQTPAGRTRTAVANLAERTEAIRGARAASPKRAPAGQGATSPTPKANTEAATTAHRMQATDQATGRAAEREGDLTTAPVVPAATSSDPTTAAAPGTDPARTTPAAVPPSSTKSLVGGLRSPLLIASGLLALVALGGLLGCSRRGPSGWQDAALALLLLPALSEGLIALATSLGPRLAWPLLSNFGAFSLLTNPLTQTLWAALTVLAVLCLALGWRSPVAGTVKASVGASSASEPGPTTAPKPRTKLASSNVNWDDDF